MTYHIKHVRSGLTAIAAVLALSSTPLTAQETTVPEPAAETPSEPAPAADPLAPEPSAAEPVTSEPEVREAAPVAAATARRAPTRARAGSERPAPAPPAAEVSAEPMTVPPPSVDPGAIPVTEPVAPPAAEPVQPATELMADEMLPIAAAGGLGILAIAGAGLAIRRRRRRRVELEHIRANQQYLNAHPEPATEPGFVRASGPAATADAAAPEVQLIKDAPRTRLPSGFDLSRFGPHVRAAYLGPTPDNPSLSLKYRLRRAAAMDQRARLQGEARPVEAGRAAGQRTASRPAWQLYDEGFMFREARSGEKKPSRVSQH